MTAPLKNKQGASNIKELEEQLDEITQDKPRLSLVKEQEKKQSKENPEKKEETPQLLETAHDTPQEISQETDKSDSSSLENSPEDLSPSEIKTQKKAYKERQAWRQRLSLSNLIVLTALTTILSAGLVAGYYALNVLYQNKLTDTWTILFLELEQRGTQILRKIQLFSDTTQIANFTGIPPDQVLYLADSKTLGRIRGDLPARIPISEFKLQDLKLSDKYSIVSVLGRQYLAYAANPATAVRLLGETTRPTLHLFLWSFPTRSFLEDSLTGLDRNIVYLISKQGQLLFSNEAGITDLNFTTRPLVQKFIGSPLQQGQLEFQSEIGPSYGFYLEVPQTNLLLFVETTKSVALASVKETGANFAIFLFFLLLIVGLVLQFPLNAFLDRLRQLVRVAWEIGEGNFNIRISNASFGEIQLLNQAFEDMGQNLNSRDEKIRALLLEQKEKFRLANELAIAHSLQDNFLSTSHLPPICGVELATHYTPAAEVAGDWYGYFYNEKKKESVFAIADVSGHGAGSAMFTSIIAAFFEEMRNIPEPFHLEKFANRLNQLFLNLGKGQVHATLLMAKYQRGTDELEVLNAGHPFPYLIYPQDSGVASESLILRSDYLGANQEFKPAVTKVVFPKNSMILMFTDGLTEGHPSGKVMSERKLSKVCLQNQGTSPTALLDQVHKAWLQYLGESVSRDDLCLLAVKAI